MLWFPHLENGGTGLKILKEIMPQADQEIDSTKSAFCDATELWHKTAGRQCNFKVMENTLTEAL